MWNSRPINKAIRARVHRWWLDDALVLGTNIGEVWHTRTDGQGRLLTAVEGVVNSLAADTDVVYVLAGSGPRRLLRFAIATPEDMEDLPDPATVADANSVTCVGKDLYLTQFHEGRLVALDGQHLRAIVDGLINPCAVTSSRSSRKFL